ncbi:bifunctional DNA primase/polymerase [Leptolyngbya sp. NIES-3755]|nr:bifunctional DNA primase/polymerase [Leptolyngbya sp. NIES-3755]
MLFNSLEINRDAAIVLLSALRREPGEKVCLRFFYPDGDSRKARDKGMKGECRFPNLPWKLMERLQAEGRGCYFVVNSGGHKDADIIRCHAIFYEHDHLDKETSRELWQHLGLPEPTIQIDTGGKSIHSYWALTSSCTIEQWQELQSNLLEFADGDRKIKNPSRVMRLAGAYHIKPGREPIQTTIINNSGNVYTYEELRSIVPKQQPSTASQSWKEFENSIQLPVSERVPLIECLSKANRLLIEQGTGEGQRNDRGYALACDLIGASNYLNSIGQLFDGLPKLLFEQYCANCSPPLDNAEIGSIWQSAEKRATGSSLPSRLIEGCIKGWLWREQRFSSNVSIRSEQAKIESHSFSQPALADSENRRLSQTSATLSIQDVQVEVSQLVEQDLTAAELTTRIYDLAKRSGSQTRDVWGLYRTYQQEQEQLNERDDRSTEINKLLKLGRHQLRLQRYLVASLAEPLQNVAQYLGSTTSAMLFTLLPTVASLCRVGTRLELIAATGFYALPILYTGLVSESGGGKSPTQKIILTPLFRLQESTDREYEIQVEQYDRELEDWQRSDRENRGSKPCRPNPREYYTVDCTREGIAQIQAQQPDRGFLGWVDELSAIVTGRNQYRGGKGSDKEALLSGRDGSPIKVNRASGKRISVTQSSYSITGATQPDTLRSLMGDFSDGSGEWARFLWCILPIQPAPFPDDAVKYDVSELLLALYLRVEALQPETYKLSPEALQRYRNWYNDLDQFRLNEPKQALRSVFQKQKGDVGVLMMLLHIINACAVGKVPAPQVSERTAKAAISLSKFCIGQVKLIHTMGDEARGELSPVLVKLIEFSDRRGWITARDAKQGINALRISKQHTSEVIRRLFHDLCEMGYGTTEGSGSKMRWKSRSPDKESVDGSKGVVTSSTTGESLENTEILSVVDADDAHSKLAEKS